MMVPMAATVAGAEPETAPKNMQAMTVTAPRAPVTLPMREFATATMRLGQAAAVHDVAGQQEEGQAQHGEVGDFGVEELGDVLKAGDLRGSHQDGHRDAQGGADGHTHEQQNEQQDERQRDQGTVHLSDPSVPFSFCWAK